MPPSPWGSWLLLALLLWNALPSAPLLQVFHYQSNAYPAKRGSFQDRVSWAGDVAKQDASIMIWNPTLEDNGTFTCSVKNPPDVQHNIPQTLLTVSRRGKAETPVPRTGGGVSGRSWVATASCFLKV